jgi:hypothetical protein
MDEIEKLVLSDRDVKPDDNILSSFLGEKMGLWNRLNNEIPIRHLNSSGSWNYYNDGKQWLYKMVQKKKTLFWAAIYEDAFRITFYFGDKAETVINESDLPASIKDNFKTAKRYGAIRPVSLKVMNDEDLEIVFKLTEIKSKLK